MRHPKGAEMTRIERIRTLTHTQMHRAERHSEEASVSPAQHRTGKQARCRLACRAAPLKEDAHGWIRASASATLIMAQALDDHD